MKKLIIAACLLIGAMSFAQENQNATETKKELRKEKRQEKKNSEQKNEALLNRMTTNLDLTTDQQAKIKDVLAAQSENMQQLKEQLDGSKVQNLAKEERKALMQKRAANKKETDAKLQAILTPEQFKKMQDNQEGMKEKAKNKMNKKRGQRQN